MNEYIKRTKKSLHFYFEPSFFLNNAYHFFSVAKIYDILVGLDFFHIN